MDRFHLSKNAATADAWHSCDYHLDGFRWNPKLSESTTYAFDVTGRFSALGRSVVDGTPMVNRWVSIIKCKDASAVTAFVPREKGPKKSLVKTVIEEKEFIKELRYNQGLQWGCVAHYLEKRIGEKVSARLLWNYWSRYVPTEKKETTNGKNYCSDPEHFHWSVLGKGGCWTKDEERALYGIMDTMIGLQQEKIAEAAIKLNRTEESISAKIRSDKKRGRADSVSIDLHLPSSEIDEEDGVPRGVSRKQARVATSEFTEIPVAAASAAESSAYLKNVDTFTQVITRHKAAIKAMRGKDQLRWSCVAHRIGKMEGCKISEKRLASLWMEKFASSTTTTTRKVYGYSCGDPEHHGVVSMQGRGWESQEAQLYKILNETEGSIGEKIKVAATTLKRSQVSIERKIRLDKMKEALAAVPPTGTEGTGLDGISDSEGRPS